MPLKLEIVTPEARVFSDEVDTVVLPGFEGELGVLPMHAPLVTTLQPGELRYTKAGKTTELAVGEGLVEITGQSARILTDHRDWGRGHR
jgi:F-type H+-transporting ATPase subunit epsilon